MLVDIIEQLPNHRHRNLKTFEEHIQNISLLVSIQSQIHRNIIGHGLGWPGNNNDNNKNDNNDDNDNDPNISNGNNDDPNNDNHDNPNNNPNDNDNDNNDNDNTAQ